MDVAETRLRKVLGGDQRYRVPLYQRPYSWTKSQLERLWSDVLDVVAQLEQNKQASHFTGSLVLDLGRAGPGSQEFLVVDGQQRLTTLSILLCAIRDHFAEFDHDQPQKRELVHERYLVDKYKSGDDRLKLVPTQADRDDYRALVDGSGDADSNSRLTIAYRYFRVQLEAVHESEESVDVDAVLEAVLGALAFVSITARGDDNVYRIFESLNNTGMKLTQGDLLRNYLFMRLGTRGEDVYASWWLPMQQRLSASDLEALFWMDIVATDSEVKEGDIYAAQRDRLDKLSTDEVFNEIARFASLSRLLEIMRTPSRSNQFGDVVRARLDRLNAWGAGSADPLILHLLSRADAGEISREGLAACLATIESFLVRRLIVGASPNAMSRIFLRAPSDMRRDVSASDALLLYFSSGRKFFASDDQVREAVLTKPLYFMGKASHKKLLLQWIEESLGSKEPIDLERASIEHILPQTLSAFWRGELARDAADDESAESIHESLVHTLGNLTLTGYNSELSNHDFPEKKALLRESGIRLHADIVNQEHWGRPEILARGRALAERIVAEWVSPVQVSDIVDTGVTWALVREAIEAIPRGRWTTYGDLAALASTYAQPVAGFISRGTTDGAWRVVQAGGNPAPGFKWGSRTEYASLTQREVLEAEGVRFDENGRADPTQRLSSAELARMLGMEIDPEREEPAQGPVVDQPAFDRFAQQLAESQPASVSHGVLEVLHAWRDAGGTLEFGDQAETSCFLMAREGRRDASGRGIWPFAIYPKSGTAEVVFQYLKDRPPFDREELREGLRTRLNDINGIDIAADRLTLRPSFRLSVLEATAERDAVVAVLREFIEQVASDA